VDDIDPELKRMIEMNNLETQLNPDEKYADRAKRILEDASPIAAMSIVDLSRRAANENLRFRAATYILDRVLGSVKDSNMAAKNAFEDLLEGISVPDDLSNL